MFVCLFICHWSTNWLNTFEGGCRGGSSSKRRQTGHPKAHQPRGGFDAAPSIGSVRLTLPQKTGFPLKSKRGHVLITQLRPLTPSSPLDNAKNRRGLFGRSQSRNRQLWRETKKPLGSCKICFEQWQAYQPTPINHYHREMIIWANFLAIEWGVNIDLLKLNLFWDFSGIIKLIKFYEYTIFSL